MSEEQVPPTIELRELQVGDLLAEGGEGQVFLMPRQPHLVFKRYRLPQDRGYLDQLVAWPATLADPDHAALLGKAAAWPTSVVTERGRAVGLLMARAPRRFALRHRDGQSRLASLSYLTADPKHRAVAYGLQLPAPLSVPRLALAQALARVLAVFEAGRPPVAHGDLSTKNVLWSLQRGAEVFLIDCDSGELEGSAPARRRRAMTPNWNDPAVAPGANPGPTTDRYSMALIFLRVAGAANFPIQARQRAGGPITLEVPVPPGPTAAALLDAGAPVWDLCARGLSLVAPADRPPASAWLGALGQLLAGLGSGTPAVGPTGSKWRAPPRPPDVRIVPVPASRTPARSYARVSPAPRYGGRPAEASAPGVGPGGLGYVPVGGVATRPRPGPGGRPAGAATPVPAARAGGVSVGPVPTGVAAAVEADVGAEMRAQLLRVARWWARRHGSAVSAMLSRGRRFEGLRLLAACAALDAAAIAVAAFAVAMVVAPVLGI